MADNLSAVVKDGVVQSSTASQLSLSVEKANENSSLDKDAFLQLLVAQMKYQDPLEPTENTEYISQLATFSQLEEMQNMTSGMTLQRAGNLIGQEVVCKVTNAQTGGTEYVSGLVDYVVYENNKAYVSIDESLYSIDDVYQVIDQKYSAAYELGKKFVSTLSSFPKLEELTLDYKDAVTKLRDTYNGMDNYEKAFINTDAIELLSKYERKIRELELKAEATGANNTDATETTEG